MPLSNMRVPLVMLALQVQLKHNQRKTEAIKKLLSQDGQAVDVASLLSAAEGEHCGAAGCLIADPMAITCE